MMLISFLQLITISQSCTFIACYGAHPSQLPYETKQPQLYPSLTHCSLFSPAFVPTSIPCATSQAKSCCRAALSHAISFSAKYLGVHR